MTKQTASIISVEGTDIRFYQAKESEFISLTDIARRFNERTDQIISNWLRTRATVEFLGAWEILYNPLFNPLNFEGIKSQTGSATFVLSVSDWVENTNAVAMHRRGFSKTEGVFQKSTIKGYDIKAKIHSFYCRYS
jgi:hypothetical protein